MKTNHRVHDRHDHQHGPDCGHKIVEHEGHKGYLSRRASASCHEGHVDEHVLGAGKTHPAGCTPPHTCTGHDASQHPRRNVWT